MAEERKQEAPVKRLERNLKYEGNILNVYEDVVEVNGHNMKDVLTALHTAKTMRHPTVILMRTVKGKGVSFMENQCGWHGVAPNEEEYKQAMAELDAQILK